MSLSDLPKLTAKKLGIIAKLLESYGIPVTKDADSVSFSFPDCPEALAAWQTLAVQIGKAPLREEKQALRFALWIHGDAGTLFLERIRTLLGLDDTFFPMLRIHIPPKGMKCGLTSTNTTPKLCLARM